MVELLKNLSEKLRKPALDLPGLYPDVSFQVEGFEGAGHWQVLQVNPACLLMTQDPSRSSLYLGNSLLAGSMMDKRRGGRPIARVINLEGEKAYTVFGTLANEPSLQFIHNFSVLQKLAQDNQSWSSDYPVLPVKALTLVSKLPVSPYLRQQLTKIDSTISSSVDYRRGTGIILSAMLLSVLAAENYEASAVLPLLAMAVIALSISEFSSFIDHNRAVELLENTDIRYAARLYVHPQSHNSSV